MTLHPTSCISRENGPHTSPELHSSAGSSGLGVSEPAPERVSMGKLALTPCLLCVGVGVGEMYPLSRQSVTRE